MKTNHFYRPDIDGLRAIAVLLVILFHANFSNLSGGFIGVDVFFVLSGYLITLNIDKELNHNRFSFKEFYLRRIRRILPVLFFVILICTIPAYLFLFSESFEKFGRTIIHTILSTNNFYMYEIQRFYFAENVDLVPFLHTWSLSVEEQFYLFWPILMFYLYKYTSLKNRFIVVLSLLILTFVISVYLTIHHTPMAYFLLPARIFELLIGGCLAIFWTRLPTLTKNQNHLVSIIGIALILIPALTLNAFSLFPGVNALWPCLGTALLIYSGKSEPTEGIVNQILKHKIPVFVGLISYSLYLWH